MTFLDIIFRFGAIGLLTVLTLLSWRDIKLRQARFILMGLCITTIAMLFSYAPEAVQMPRAVFIMARIVDVPNLTFIWLFGFQVFDDGFKIKTIHIFALLAYILPAFVCRTYDLGLLPIVPHWFIVIPDFVATGLILYLLFVILKGRRDDMVNERRRIRIFFVLTLIAITLSVTTADLIMSGYHRTFATWIKVLSAFPLTIWAYLWLARFGEDKLLFNTSREIVTAAPKVDPRDALLETELKKLMENEKFYTESGLTIRTLSEKLKAPEHRLRSLINKGLGFRNFSAFLNSYRIAAVKAALEEPKNSRIPVLTIAMDVGFNSLAPFNRAFRDIEGMTPSAYRQKIQGNLANA